MILETVVNEDLGCASYVVGCQVAGAAFVVDPPLDTRGVEATLKAHGLRLVGIVETHTHADHVSGHGTLAAAHGVPIHIHRSAGVAFSNEPLDDGDRLRVGNVELVALHTPGHRPEHTGFAVFDHTRAEEPWFLLSGDSLFVGDVARPDLAVAGEDGAHGLYLSLRDVILGLADGVEVFPGHVAGSLCGRGMNAKASSTIGFERRFNPMLVLATEAEFVSAATSDLAPKPPNLERIVQLNMGPLRPALELPTRLDRVPDGVALLDVRDSDQWAAGHVDGALHAAGAERGFGTRIGWFLDADDELCVLAASTEEAEVAARKLNAVGFLRISGWLLADDASLTRSTRSLNLEQFRAQSGTNGFQILDVREPDESPESVAGAIQIPYRLLSTASLDAFDRERTLTVICGSGVRAPVAAAILERRGLEHVQPVLGGGMADL